MNEMNSISVFAPRIYPVADSLLDSSLIAQTNKKIYNIKLIKCGNDYIQIYKYEDNKIKKDNNWENGIIKNKKVKNNSNKNKCKEIRKDNILRSKLSLQRLIKSNIEEFKTFITLTFKDNITDIEVARSKKEQLNFLAEYYNVDTDLIARRIVETNKVYAE